MSEVPFGEATIVILPDTRGFVTALQTQVKKAIDTVEKGGRAPKVKVAPTLSRNFVGDLRTQVNRAIAQAQKGIKPIQVSAVLTNVSTAAIAREVRGQVRQVAVSGGGRATRATGGAREIDAASDAAAKRLDTQRLLDSQFGRSATILGTVTTEQRKNTAELVKGARAGAEMTAVTAAEADAEGQLARARQLLREATLAGRGTSVQAARFRAADAAALEVLARRTGEVSDAQRQAAAALRQTIRSSEEGAAAVNEGSRAATASARAHSQLRRGVLATSLSFLGIRGATLAASAQFLAGAAAIALFAKALDNATRFADQLNVFRATTGATATELERVRDTARALGADLSLPGVTAADAAEAMTELAKAGLDVQQSIAGARGVLQLATAAAIDNAQAVELVANALNAFELSGADATRVADTFANAANAAQGSIVDIGIAFQQSAAAGRQVGLSFEDTSEFLTVLARAGLRGSDAGTSLRTALIRLINPSKEAAGRLKELGVETRNAAGNLRPDVFIQITNATKNLTKAERDRVIALIGGQDAFRAISILGRQSIQDFIRLRRELRQQGTAATLARARMQGLRGALEGLSNQLNTIGVRAGQALTPALQSIVEGISGATASFASSGAAASAFAGVVDTLNISLNALGATLSVVIPVLGVFATTLASGANLVGVPTILGAIAAYKLFPPVLTRAQKSFTNASGSISRFVEINRRAASIFGASRLSVLFSQLTRNLNLTSIAIAGVAAGLIFLITRETSAERATRKFTEAVDAAIDARGRLQQAQETQRSTFGGEDRARLDLLNAQRAVATARANLAGASRGSRERVRAETELAVALDDVASAQQRVNQAAREAADANLVLANARRRERAARAEEISTLNDLVEASQRQARLALRGGARRRGETGAAQQARLQRAAAAEFSAQLDRQIAKLRESDDADSIRQANRLQRLKAFTDALGKVPTERAIEITINARGARAQLARLVSEFDIDTSNLRQSFVNAISGPEVDAQMRAAIIALFERIKPPLQNKALEIGIEGGRALGQGLVEGLEEKEPDIGNAAGGVIARALGQLAGLQRQATRLEIAGASPEARLANVRQQEANARATLAELERNGAAEGSINKQLDILAGIVRERRAIEAEIAAAQKEAADEAKDARDAADEDALGRLERRRDRAQDRISDAKATETLADDLRATIVFRNLIRRQINRIKDLIKDRKTQIEAIRALQAIEHDLDREITDLQKQRRQQISDRIAESIQLDIDFFNLTGNVVGEIRAREREIARLRKLQAQYKKGTIEYRRLRNLIAEQQKAIEELTKQQKEKNNAFAEMSFQFLTTQAGFAANLLGNLLPMGSIGGTLGGGGNFVTGPSAPGGGAGGFQLPREQASGLTMPNPNFRPGGSPQAGLDEAARRAEAEGRQGFTTAQAATLIALTKKMVELLSGLDAKSKHPEQKKTARANATAMDAHK